MTESVAREVRRGTALIVDVVNWYGQEPRSLEAVAVVLDDLYDGIIRVIEAQGGEVVKWLGDGALCCFWEGGHELAAVRAAVALQGEFKRFGRRHGFEQSGLTISIATGEMVSGTFGTGRAAHYDVFGEPVMCTATVMPEGSGAITLCAATYRALADVVEVEPLAEHEHFGLLYALGALKE